MRQTLNRYAFVAALGLMLLAGNARADVTITSFDDFVSDALYPSWALPASTVTSGPTSYDITATGYGSNYKYIGFPEIIGAGNTTVQLTVTLSGPPAADGMLGPIVELLDADGTDYNYAWYGQTLGSHVLTLPVESPTWSNNAGTTAGLDLNTLTHMHIQLDPGGFGTAGAYTVSWQDLSLVGGGSVPEPSSVMLLLGSVAMIGIRRR